MMSNIYSKRFLIDSIFTKPLEFPEEEEEIQKKAREGGGRPLEETKFEIVGV